jgi:protein-tyrosine phosphatase
VIDLHCHLLPAVDDGSRSVMHSAAVLRRWRDDGVTAVCLTPHVLASRAGEGVPRQHDAAFEALMVEAPPEVTLYRGAEIMLDVPATAAALRPHTLGGTRYVLVEFPRMIAEEAVRNALSVVVRSGLVPVLAHPERYTSCSAQAAHRWRQAGARLQVDATTLLSPQPRGDRARSLLRHGLGDIIAADNHGDSRSLPVGYRALVEFGGEEQAELLAIANPAAILADEPLAPVPPLEIRRTILQRIRRLFATDQ